LAVSVSGKGDAALEAGAREMALSWRVPYLPRRRKEAVKRLLEQAEALLVLGRNGWTLRDRQGVLRWSLGMAALRIGRIDAGGTDDTLVRVADLRAGDHVLDATLGLGQDALVASRMVGSSGRIVGWEKSLALFALVSAGMASGGALAERIEVQHQDAATALRKLGARTFDIVLFDPMFERMRPALRRFADHAPLTQEMIAEAQRVARRSVVVKGARYSRDLAKLGLEPLPASRFATVLWARLPGSAI
jgi:16S rRNA (guanine1516-N2)-methyltransferase